jgi:hypothetical protein
MDKKTKMLLGVGAVAVVGYLVYQQMNKPKGFMNANGMIFAPQETGNVFMNASGMSRKLSVPFSIACPKGYLNNTPHTLDGQTVYECTGPTGTGGVYTTVPPKGVQQSPYGPIGPVAQQNRKLSIPFSISCPNGYLDSTPHTLDGQTVYECKGPTGTGGVYTTVPPKGVTPATSQRIFG